MKIDNFIKNKKLRRTLCNKAAVVTAVAVLGGVGLVPILQTLAAAPPDYSSHPDNYALICLRDSDVTLPDYSNVDRITATYTHGKITMAQGITAALYSEIGNEICEHMIYAIAGEDFLIQATADSGYVANIIVDGEKKGASAQFPVARNNGNLTNIGVEFLPEGGNPDPTPDPDPDPDPDPGETTVTSSIDYSYSGEGSAKISINGVEPSNGSATYTYDNSGNVTMTFETEPDKIITDLSVNGTSYSDQLPSTQDEILGNMKDGAITFDIQVPYAAAYNVETTTAENDAVGRFSWSYTNEEAGSSYIQNGSFDLVSVAWGQYVYPPSTIINVDREDYLKWQQDDNGGFAVLPTGALVTVKILPDAGYELAENGIITPQETQDAGTYTFSVPGGKFDLGIKFIKSENLIIISSDIIKSSTIELSDDELGHGTVSLVIMDAAPSDEEAEGFEKAAKDYDIAGYLSLNPAHVISQRWSSPIDELEEGAVITLTLKEGVDGNKVVMVYQKDDGTYEIIPTTYDAESHTITFKAYDFVNNYAIAYRTVSDSDDSDDEDIVIPNTGQFTAAESGATVGVTGVALAIIGAVIFAFKRRRY